MIKKYKLKIRNISGELFEHRPKLLKIGEKDWYKLE